MGNQYLVSWCIVISNRYSVISTHQTDYRIPITLFSKVANEIVRATV